MPEKVGNNNNNNYNNNNNNNNNTKATAYWGINTALISSAPA